MEHELSTVELCGRFELLRIERALPPSLQSIKQMAVMAAVFAIHSLFFFVRFDLFGVSAICLWNNTPMSLFHT